MNKEIPIDSSFKLQVKDIFVSLHDSSALTPVGSRFEGVRSINDFLVDVELKEREGGKRKLSDEKRREWVADIDAKFREIGEIMVREIPEDENLRQNLVNQHTAIVNRQRRLRQSEQVLVEV